MQLPTLSVEAILSAAKEQTGLSDFGDGQFIEPFEKLIEALHKEAELSATGTFALFAMYLQLMTNRLRFQEDLKNNPEILEEDILPPIAVIGMPRSGTTKLHRVLAADPGIRSLKMWQLMNPAPFPGQDGGDVDPRITFAEAALAQMAQSFPDVFAGHPMAARDPEEETSYLMEMTLDGPLVPVRAYVPSFAEWRWGRSMGHSYRYLRKLFQYLQWQDRKVAGSVRPFVLKSPLHLAHISEFLEAFPGATIVHCHRDPIDSVPSFARLLEVGWSMMTDRQDLERCGVESIRLLKTHIERYIPQREQLESDVTFIDAAFSQIVSDAPSLLDQVYRSHGLTPSSDIADRLSQWEDHNAADRFGKHVYSLDRYGLTEDQIRIEFADYYRRFDSHL